MISNIAILTARKKDVQEGTVYLNGVGEGIASAIDSGVLHDYSSILLGNTASKIKF